MASIHGFSIKNHKSFRGRDWDGDQGDIWYEGKKVGWYNNDGNGGCADIDFYLAGEKRNEYEKLLKEAVEKYYKANPMTGQFADLEPNDELFMSELLTLMDKEKEFKKMQKRGYKVLVTYSVEEYSLDMICCLNIQAAENIIAKKQIKVAKIYTSLADFIIK